jgi:hypothetical protein
MRLSGLQREVLVLYRRCLREVGKKPVVRKNHQSFLGHNYQLRVKLKDPSAAIQKPLKANRIVAYIWSHHAGLPRKL